MKRNHVLVCLMLIAMLLLLGNLPAPYYACQGKTAGDTCNYGYGSGCSSTRGICTLSDSFTDDPNTTDLNESLICVTR